MKYKDWHSKALSLSDQGMSGRQIAEILNMGKTQVNDVLKYYREHDSLPEEISDFVKKEQEGAKILLFDLETAPELYMGFGRYKQNIQEDFVYRNSFIMSYSAKWLDGDTISSVGLPHYDSYKEDPYDDYQLCLDLHKLLSECDWAIAHNIKFDWKTANTRFVYHGLDPISPTKLIDTLNIAKANFRFPTNRLETIARYLEVGQKLPHTGAKMWRDCYDGDMEAWQMMIDYNVVDVEVLEAVYLKLRAYDRRHPNAALYYKDQDVRCVCCGSPRLVETDKKAYTSVSEFDVYQCQDCGKHNRARKNRFTKEKRESLLMNVQ